MVMCEMSLSRREELVLVVACELRPALAVGDPPGPFVDFGRVAVIEAASFHLWLRPAESVAA
jgi:hypothetical protein